MKRQPPPSLFLQIPARVLFGLFLVCRVDGVAQESVTSVQRIQQFVADESSSLVNGFTKAIAGETIDYHSANELARSALLVRTTDGKMAIEWKTGEVPPVANRGFVTFFWLAGLAGSKGVHAFDMHIDNERWYRFHTPKDSTENSWTLRVADGGSLTFVATESDRFGDLFGYMFLKVPVSSLKENEAVTIRIAGEAAGSSCWYMTFQHPMEWNVRAAGLPVLIRRGDALYQQVKVFIEHYASPREVTVFVDSAHTVIRPLAWGVNTVLLPVKAV